jgi:DNA-directed RNA polymerase subunit RPC12/RpoP
MKGHLLDVKHVYTFTCDNCLSEWSINEWVPVDLYMDGVPAITCPQCRMRSYVKMKNSSTKAGRS